PTTLPALVVLSAVEADPVLPSRLQTVVGTSSSLAGRTVWSASAAGVSARELPPDTPVSAGRIGATIASWDLETGDVHLWSPYHPSDAAAVTTISVPDAAGETPIGAGIALSPDETLLAVARYDLPEGARDDLDGAGVARGYLVDVAFEEVNTWEWFDAAISGQSLHEVTELRWNRTSTAIYVSLGRGGGSRGDVSYRYDLWTEDAVELTGVAAVWDIGYLDQVVGLGMPSSPEEFEYPEGSDIGRCPLVLWRDGELVRLPSDPRLVSWEAAWISDPGDTIVVRGGASSERGTRSCLEVLKRREGGWEVSTLFVGDDTLSIVYGVGFEPNSSIFCFQAETQPTAPQGHGTEMRLFEVNTALAELLSPAFRLPGDDDAWTQTLGVVGTESCAAG
ncbi:MAG: hypothetical protein JW990_14390, partial [Thermoleophilia bacterium]|nr:hypothetical protein [Thermoleophilia bacterium]